MGETTNYGLYITDDNTERFLDWRTKMNGADDSNMTKIDTALGSKASKSRTVDSVLLAEAWSGSAPTYTQTISVSGLSAEQNGTISLPHTTTSAQRDAARAAILSVVGQSDGSLTIAADGDKPSIDIPVCIILLG